MSVIEAQQFTKVMFALLNEAFDTMYGYFPNPGTSLFKTLATVFATEASLPVGGKCACWQHR